MGQSVSQLDDRYFVQKVKLGQGSFGTVWRAVDRQKGNTVAIKQMDKASLPRRGVNRQDIEREVCMMRVCHHENITRLFDTFEDASSIYLALEYCDGGDFGDKVKERGWAMEEAEVAGFVRQMCAAIHALHSFGICHRDIKPDNFMVSGSSTLKLADFGLAVFLASGQLHREKCGTPAFMAPELHCLPKRSPGYSFPVDVWAAGVSMYMVMFAGRHPFITDSGVLDERMLMKGELDFRNREAFKGFFNFGAASLRFSDEARLLCSRMVDPDPRRRISSGDAARCPWLLGGSGRGRAANRQRCASPAQAPPLLPCMLEPGTPEGRAMPCGRKHASPEGPPLLPPAPPHGCENLDPNPRVASQSGSPSALPGGPQAEAARKGTPRAEASRKASKISSPQDDQAAKEAARLKEENDALQAELQERRRREEQLVHQQRQLEEQHRNLQRQRSKELHAQSERLMQRELQLQRAEQERRQLERQCPPQPRGSAAVSAAEQPPKVARMPPAPSGGAGPWGAEAADGPHSGEPAPRPGFLQPGTRCRYESGTYGWMPAVVQSYNESNGTYNLDVRQQAALDKISPLADAKVADAWPPGTLAAYHSVSIGQWLPTAVVSFNEADGTYNLDVRDHADIDRIRVRVAERPRDGVAKRSNSRQVI